MFMLSEVVVLNQALEKLRVLADAAKYDVSCASSGLERKNSNGIGNSRSFGICHSWASDGRCISLLKILLSNNCVYNCIYCVNRCSAETKRASFEPEEIAEITIEFYRRNYIEGLFLSSAVEASPDNTMEKMLKSLQLLRHTYGFHGYIHAKIIPGTNPLLIDKIGLLADRISVNIELPSENSLQLLAPQKKLSAILSPMSHIDYKIKEYHDLRKSLKSVDKFAGGGQSTQMIIGASKENDYLILNAAQHMYQRFHLKRVYYSAYMPVVSSSLLPVPFTPPPLKRENRLYQADWLLRFYFFKAEELIDLSSPFLDLDLDPKISWALRNMHQFPLEINKASYEELLRVPGIGVRSAYKIVTQRRKAAVKYEHLLKMGIVVKRAKYFITCCGKYYGKASFKPEAIREALLPADESEQQLSFWDRN